MTPTAKLLLIAGVFVLSIALRGLDGILPRKLGVLGFLATSFLIGWFVSDWWPMGLVFVSFWLVWPWYELITRVKKIAMPVENPLRHKSPPHPEFFPALGELSDEMEQEGFEHVEDLGREWDEAQQFFRIYHKTSERVQAVICLVEQQQFAFYYLRILSRAKDGTVWTTWNYPFSLNLKLSPDWRINRESGDKSFLELMESHRLFLASHLVHDEDLDETNPDRLQEQLQGEQSRQIAHNVTAGILRKDPDGAIRYTWRGLWYIWVQLLRDFVRLS